MKTYTFKVNNNNKDSYNISDLKKDIYNAYSDKYDWWGMLNPKYTKKNNSNNDITIDIALPKDYSNITVDDAIDALLCHNTTQDDYDYIISGIPVKIYDTYIQYGYDIIPIDYANIFAAFKKPTKKIIIDIITKIKINK